MKALIFNSGIGKRMGELTAKQPKCMAEIGKGFTIISWQLELLEKYNIKDVIITTGPFSELLKNYVLSLNKNLNITFVHNSEYDKTNYIYSMYCAKEYLNDDFLILHGDLVMEPSVIEDLIVSKKSVVCVDKLLPLPQKDFKAKIKDGLVSKIGIEFFGEDCIACQPAYLFLKKDFLVWLKEVEHFCEKGEKNVYAENAFNEKSHLMNIYTLELHSRLCNEIDNLEDLSIISHTFLEKC